MFLGLWHSVSGNQCPIDDRRARFGDAVADQLLTNSRPDTIRSDQCCSNDPLTALDADRDRCIIHAKNPRRSYWSATEPAARDGMPEAELRAHRPCARQHSHFRTVP